MASKGRKERYKSAGSKNSVVTNAQNKQIGRIANRTRNLKNEQYRIVNEDGNVVLEKKGSRHEVASSVGEKREYMNGGVSIHNHPEGGTFSTADLSDFGFGARQIVVAAPEGTYKLTNMKYGTKDQFNGWYNMREAMENAGINKEVSYGELRAKADSVPRVAKLKNELSSIANSWAKENDAGKPKDELIKKYSGRYDEVKERYSKALHEEIRNAEVKPSHDFFKKNARKYGFKYEFERK